jgi:hypothetical protein
VSDEASEAVSEARDSCTDVVSDEASEAVSEARDSCADVTEIFEMDMRKEGE